MTTSGLHAAPGSASEHRSSTGTSTCDRQRILSIACVQARGLLRVRRQGLEPRTRGLRARTRWCRRGLAYAGGCRFRRSAPDGSVVACRLVLATCAAIEHRSSTAPGGRCSIGGRGGGVVMAAIGLPVSSTICTASALNCGLNLRRCSGMDRSSPVEEALSKILSTPQDPTTGVPGAGRDGPRRADPSGRPARRPNPRIPPRRLTSPLTDPIRQCSGKEQGAPGTARRDHPAQRVAARPARRDPRRSLR